MIVFFFGVVAYKMQIKMQDALKQFYPSLNQTDIISYPTRPKPRILPDHRNAKFKLAKR
jgi:hypothetical protein